MRPAPKKIPAFPSSADLQSLQDASSPSPPTTPQASQPPAGKPPFPPPIPDHDLLRCIGRGSYGEVWLARNVLGQFRAVKVIYRCAFEHERPYEREFDGIREFEPISRLHESQVDILHVGRNDAAGCFYYVMELADDARERTEEKSEVGDQKSGVGDQQPEGRRLGADQKPQGAARSSDLRPLTSDFSFYVPHTLKLDLHRRGRLPVDECIQIGLALTTALENLHSHRLVHRDIKPSNIIFVGGVPKLADIGLVASMDATMSFVGTSGFLPPEGPGTPQADLYSLGKVLYEMSTGRDRQDFPKLPPELLEVAAGVSPGSMALLELNTVILKACHQDSRQRYQSAREMAADLALLQRGQSVKHKRAAQRRLAWLAKMGVAAAAVTALAALWPYVKLGKLQRHSAAPIEITSIAVLPFFNESKARQHKYLSQALTDETRQALTNIAGLRVATRQSAFAFKGTNSDPREVGEQLRVRTVLAGSMKKSSNQLHVAARLVNVADGAELWSAVYDGPFEQIAMIHGAIAERVAGALRFPLDPAVLRRSEISLSRKRAAYQLYSDGWKLLMKQTRDGIAQSIGSFSRAVDLDPNFALAYCGLADAHASQCETVVSPVQGLADMRKDALRAVEIDDHLPEGHAYLGLALFFSYEFAEAELEFQRALALEPSSQTSLLWYGRFLRSVGRLEEARIYQLRALQLAPNDRAVLRDWISLLRCEGRFEEALQQAEKLDQMVPGWVIVPYLRGSVYVDMGQFQPAISELEEVRAKEELPLVAGLLGYAYGRAGRTNEALGLLQELDTMSRHRYMPPTARAETLAGLGDTSEAIRLLYLGYEERCRDLLHLKVDPHWSVLRGDPRFQALLRKMGLEK